MRTALVDANFEIVEPAWSTNTFTVFAVPSMLELRQVAMASPIEYGHTGSLMRIMRGDSLTANSLRRAGFTYHHIESGWDGDTCEQTDHCYEAPFWDEMMFKLFEHSLIGSWLADSKGSYMRDGTFNTFETLLSLESEFNDGDHDFIYGHLLLPHDPYIVDADCELVPPSQESDRIAAQLSCVDRMIGRLARLAGDQTAVLITGDHGTNSLEQRNKPGGDWSDGQIAERLGVFLAYRLPEGCPRPRPLTTVDAMRTLVGCTVDLELPAQDDRALVGASAASVWVDSERIDHIVDEILSANLSP